MLKISILAVLLLGYFGICAYLVVSTYDSYEVGSTALPLLARRNSETMMLGLLLYESLLTQNSKYICASGDTKSTFDTLYAQTLEYEQELLSYKKSSKSIFSEYRDITDVLDSDQLCSIFSTSAGEPRL